MTSPAPGATVWRMTRAVVEVERRAHPRGLFRLEARDDCFLSIHASEPARVSCHGGKVASLALRGETSVLPLGTYDECLQDDPTETLEVRIPQALLRLAAEEMNLDPDRAALELRHCFRDDAIEHIAWALEADARGGSLGGLLYREGLSLALAARLLEGFRAPDVPRGGLSTPQLSRVREHVDAHLAGDLSLLRLARIAGVSCSHFRVLFKRSTGLAPHAYVIQRRVQRARALLLEGDLPASQIASEVGFAHQSHMARWMRRVLGVTPAVLDRARR